jgi:hypothetical protein
VPLGQLTRTAAGLAVPLGVTIAVELAVAAVLGLRSRRQLALVAWMNVLTNPLLVYAYSVVLLVSGSRPSATVPVLVLAVLEIAVVVTEWGLMRWALALPSRRALWLSVAMNASSFAVGVALAAARVISLPR